MEHDLVNWCGQYCKYHTRDVKANSKKIVVYKCTTAVEIACVVNAELVDAASGRCEGKKEGGTFKLDTDAADGG